MRPANRRRPCHDRRGSMQAGVAVPDVPAHAGMRTQRQSRTAKEELREITAAKSAQCGGVVCSPHRCKHSS